MVGPQRSVAPSVGPAPRFPRPSAATAWVRLDAVRELIDQVRSLVGGTEVVVLLEAGAEVWLNLFHAAGAAVDVADTRCMAWRVGLSMGLR